MKFNEKIKMSMFPPSTPALSTPLFSQSLLLLSSGRWVVSLMHLEQREPSVSCWKSMHVCVLLQMLGAFKCTQEVKCENAAVHHFLNVLCVKRCEFIWTHINDTKACCAIANALMGHLHSNTISPWHLLVTHVHVSVRSVYNVKLDMHMITDRTTQNLSRANAGH